MVCMRDLPRHNTSSAFKTRAQNDLLFWGHNHVIRGVLGWTDRLLVRGKPGLAKPQRSSISRFGVSLIRRGGTALGL